MPQSPMACQNQTEDRDTFPSDKNNLSMVHNYITTYNECDQCKAIMLGKNTQIQKQHLHNRTTKNELTQTQKESKYLLGHLPPLVD